MLALTLPAHAASGYCAFNDQAPDSHRVVKNDTLWDIATTFLKNPWCWPQVWDQNRDQIRNPHWIYPGQIIYFDRKTNRLSLSDNMAGTSGSGGPQRLSPRMRSDGLADAPIPTIDPQLLALIAQTPRLSDSQAEFSATPRLIAFADNRSVAGRFDTVYAKGDLGSQKTFNVVRSAAPVIDPENGTTLAYTMQRVATVSLVQPGTQASEAHRLVVADSISELRLGDRLLPFQPASALPPLHYPDKAVSGQLAAVLKGSRWASRYDLVAINRGKLHGLDAGSLLSVMKQVKISAHEAGNLPTMSLPPETVGTLLVFDVADLVSYAVLMHSRDTVAPGDAVQTIPADAP
jgi:hypothetical protein